MSSTPSQPLQPLATQTLGQIKEALQTSEAASVAQVIQLIREIADKGDSMPVQQLADIIARDLTTMSKVLRVANTLGYNPEGIEVTTITQAINVIGFEKVRNLAVSLLLVENAEGKVLSEESREVAGLAVASGLISQSIIEQLNGSDPEQSLVCTALRNYGKLLLTSFLLEQYRQARSLIGTLGADAAYRQVFGLTPLELGYEVLHSAQLPRRILRCLQETAPERIAATRATPDDLMVVMADFAVKLCELIQETGGAPAAFERASGQLLSKFGRSIPLTAKELSHILKAVDRKLNAFGMVQGVRVFTSPLIKNIGALVSQREPGITSGGASASAAKKTGGDTQPKDILSGGLAEVAQLVATQPENVDGVLDVARRCVQMSLSLTHCIIFLKEPGSTLFAARVGSGTLFEQIKGRPLLDSKKEDIFKAALTRGEDLLIQSSSDPKISFLIPAWLQAVGRNRTLIILPIRDEVETFALLLGVSELLRPLELAVQLKPQLRLLRGHVAIVRSML